MLLLKGKIVFDPVDKTNKHKSQASWKKVAMVIFEANVPKDGDGERKGICEYYAWFIKRRYSIALNKPLRRAHVTFINDRGSDMNGRWDEIKAKYDGKEIDVVVSVDPRTDCAEPGSTGHWWLTVPEECRHELHGIREELGLGRPYYGLHLSIGHVNEKNREQGEYIHNLIKKYGGSYN